MTTEINNGTEQQERQPYITLKKLPFGMEMKIGGKELFTIIVLILLGVPLGYLVLKHDEATLKVLGELVEAQNATTYILTLTQDDRVKLNLAKPKKIREMERDAR